MITPLFLISLRYWTAPVYICYNSKLSSFMAPFAAIPFFYCSHWDLKILSIIVFMMNFSAFWYHMDPTTNLFAAATLKVRNKSMGSKIVE